MRVKDEKHFCIYVAGHTIAVQTLFTDTYALCKEYLCNDDPEQEICIREEDIILERIETEKMNVSRRDGYLETLAVYRKISELMLSYDTFLMHGAVIATGQNAAYMFAANSGEGKTTHVQKWLEKAEKSFVVNGDKPLIKITDAQAIACGTPWCGKEHLGAKVMVPLKAIVLMERGEDNVIQEITFGKAFTLLLQQTYRPADAEKMRKTLVLLSMLKNRVHFYQFWFNNLKPNAFEVAYTALTGQK